MQFHRYSEVKIQYVTLLNYKYTREYENYWFLIVSLKLRNSARDTRSLHLVIAKSAFD
jgi:hypothetical protein